MSLFTLTYYIINLCCPCSQILCISNLKQSLPVLEFQAAVLTQTRTTTAPRFIELWNRALGKLIHDPHVRDCSQILVRQDQQDTDYAAIRTIVQANPPQLLPQLRGADFSGASCFDGNYPNYIYFSAGLIEALEAAQPGFF